MHFSSPKMKFGVLLLKKLPLFPLEKSFPKVFPLKSLLESFPLKLLLANLIRGGGCFSLFLKYALFYTLVFVYCYFAVFEDMKVQLYPTHKVENIF